MRCAEKTRAFGDQTRRGSIVSANASSNPTTDCILPCSMVVRAGPDLPVTEEYDRPDRVYVTGTVRSHVNDAPAFVDKILLALDA